MNRALMITLLLLIIFLTACQKFYPNAERVFILENEIYYTAKLDKKTALYNIDGHLVKILDFKPDIIFNDLDYFKYDVNSGVLISYNDSLINIIDEQILSVSNGSIFMIGHNEDTYIYNFFDNDTLFLNHQESYEQVFRDSSQHYFIISVNDSLKIFKDNFSLAKIIQSSSKNFLHNGKYGLNIIQLENGVIKTNKNLITLESKYDSILSYERIRNQDFFLLKKNDMIYLIDEKGFIQKSYQYKQGYYKIISLNGDIHVGILKSNLFQVKGNPTQFFDQLYFDTYEISIIFDQGMYIVYNTLNENKILCNTSPRYNPIHPKVMSCMSESEIIYFNSYLDIIFNIEKKHFIDFNYKDGFGYLLKSNQNYKIQLIQINLENLTQPHSNI